MLALIQAWYGLRKHRRAEVDVFLAAVASPPTGIHFQLLQVGEAPNLRHARNAAGLQVVRKVVEIDRLVSLGFQVRL